jgi:hypothetical protein
MFLTDAMPGEFRIVDRGCGGGAIRVGRIDSAMTGV